MSKKYIFVYVNAPQSPSMVSAIFPYEMLKEAIDFTNSASGYYEMRTAEWVGFGKVPEFYETKLM